MHLLRIVALLSFVLTACDDASPSPGPTFVYACPVPADDVACVEPGIHSFAAGAEISFEYPNAQVRPAVNDVDEGQLAFVAFRDDVAVDFFHVMIAKVASLELDTKDPSALVITPVDRDGAALGGRLGYTATIDSDAATIEVVGRTIRVHALRTATVNMTVKGGEGERTFALEVKA